MPRQRLALLAAIVLPLAQEGAALVAWKLAYYGDLFPTAFYAKSALEPYHGQGWYYIYLFLEKNWFIGPLGLLLLVGSLATRGAAGLLTRRHIVLLAAGGPPALMEARRVQALVAAPALAGLPVRAAYEGGMCVFGYYSRLPYLVEMTGLTQYSLAKTPIMARGHVGHEKTASDDWLTENHIHFVFSHLPGDALKARIWIYDEALMERLRRDPRVAFTPIEITLREAERHIAAAPYDEARRIYAVLERYYFRGAGPAKQARAEALRRQVEARRAPGTR